MKIKILLVALSLMLMTKVSVQAQESDDFKPGGKLFGQLFTDFQTTFSGGRNNSAFEVARSFLGFEYGFSREISSRILYDGTTEVINGKTIYSGYLRNAYLQYSSGTLTFQGGLIGSEQLSMMDKIWDYRFLSKPPIYYSGMIQFADLGVSAKLNAGERLVLDVSVTNGRGFNDLAADGTYRLTTGFTLTPAMNMLIRGFYDMMGPTGRMQRTASITAAYTSPRLTAGVEYFRQDNHKMTEGSDYSGISLFTRLALSERTMLFARYDHISSVIPEGETNPWHYSKDGSYIFAGIDFSVARGVRISPNFKTYLPSASGADVVTTLGLNVEAKF